MVSGIYAFHRAGSVRNVGISNWRWIKMKFLLIYKLSWFIKGLWYKLQYYGLKQTALKLLNNYLTNRTPYVVVDDVMSAKLPLKVGVPQGSKLGPLLFIIYTNDPIVYADNTTLVASLNTFHSPDRTIEININNELVRVNNWLRANKLSINKKKTKAMIFHTPQRRVYYPHLQIENSTI